MPKVLNIYLCRLCGALVKPRVRPPWIILVVLWLVGALFWFLNFGCGQMQFIACDWPKEIAYLNVQKSALMTGTVPWKIDHAIQETRHFFAIPETCFAPQIVALRFLSAPSFVVFDTILLFTIGLAGCAVLAARRKLSLLGFLVLYLLFNFNGYITSHIGVGHSMWLAYYYLPWLFISIEGVLAGNRKFGWGCALALSLIVAQGGIHMFVWCMILIIMLGLIDGLFLRSMPLILGWTLVLNVYRLIPAAIEYRQYSKPFRGGFSEFGVFVDAFLTLKSCTTNYTVGHSGYDGLMWHEYDTYVGLPGVVLLGAGVIFYFISRAKDGARPPPLRGLYVAAAGLLLFSFGDLYSIVYNSGLPLLNSERCPSRMVVLPFICVIILAADGFSMNCGRLTPLGQKAVIGLMTLTASSLWQHAMIWAPVRIENARVIVSGPELTTIVNCNDTTYKTVVAVSWVTSIIGLCIFSSILYKSRIWERLVDKQALQVPAAL